jgi:hypothetical protein
MLAAPEDTNWVAYGESGNLCSQPFYKRLQLDYFDLSSAEDQAQCPEHMGDCLATEPHPNSSAEK